MGKWFKGLTISYSPIINGEVMQITFKTKADLKRKVEEAIKNGEVKNLSKALSTNATVEDMKIAYMGYGITATVETSKGAK